MIILVRGLPGSGKSTFVKHALSNFHHVEADQFFTSPNGSYCFDASKLGEAHAWCQSQVAQCMKGNIPVAVSNTFTQKWEMTVYYLLAEAYGYNIKEINLFDSGMDDAELAKRNIHKVPESQISVMRNRWQV